MGHDMITRKSHVLSQSSKSKTSMAYNLPNPTFKAIK
jgi:hypothetical protein